jgi:hypothetical protein
MGVRLRTAVFFALGIALLGSPVLAAPAILITAPPAGQALTDVRPTVVVSYTSSDPAVPINVSSLALDVTENGRGVQGTVTKNEFSATFVPTHDIAAGSLVVNAGVSDVAGASAAAAQSYDVLPTFQALVPDIGVAGDNIAITARGLDAALGSNALVFPSVFAVDGLSVNLTSVDPTTATGHATVPGGVVTGIVYLVVNGKRSPTGVRFTVASNIAWCGNMYGGSAGGSLNTLADGSLLAQYWYSYYYIGWPDPNRYCPTTAGYRGSVVRQVTSTTQLVWDDHWTPSLGVERVIDVAVDMAGENWAVLTESDAAPPYRIYRKGDNPRDPATAKVVLPNGTLRLAAFDPDGNLLLTVSEEPTTGPWRLTIAKVTAQDLAGSGSATPVHVATVRDPMPTQVRAC